MNLPNVDNVATGARIEQLMKEKKVSMYKLQMSLGLQSATNIYAWLRGKHLPSVDYLVKLATIFGCSVDDIIVTGGTNE